MLNRFFRNSATLRLALFAGLCLSSIQADCCQSAVSVWANPRSHVYHCPGSRYFQYTKQGFLVGEDVALTQGFRPAGGLRCSAAPRPDHGVAQNAPRTPKVTQCGFERWPVKILLDEDAGKVDLRPTVTTISKLLALEKPRRALPYKRRLAPTELTTFAVMGRVQRIKREADSDWHIVISDPLDESLSLVVELPAADCAIGSPQEETFRRLQAKVAQLKAGDLIKATGVAFFDRAHGQRGAARNGFELHPLLAVE
jgi:hypothetical protein